MPVAKTFAQTRGNQASDDRSINRESGIANRNRKIAIVRSLGCMDASVEAGVQERLLDHRLSLAGVCGRNLAVLATYTTYEMEGQCGGVRGEDSGETSLNLILTSTRFEDGKSRRKRYNSRLISFLHAFDHLGHSDVSDCVMITGRFIRKFTTYDTKMLDCLAEDLGPPSSKAGGYQSLNP
ncbi:hypothetical protein BDZ91DRAFT_758898 [Kalaharituber pfeilii]|nr:hypothetical protein BDZ91DRAFT_758898 [Kalaharituber pfeilii]